MTYTKPDLTIAAVEDVLERYWGKKATNISAVAGGNVAGVYSFDMDGRTYGIRFHHPEMEVEKDHFAAKLLTSHGVPYPAVHGQGVDNGYVYEISDWIQGYMVADMDEQSRAAVYPEMVEVITRLNQVDISSTTGFGPLLPGGNGAHLTWEDFVIAFFAADQPGSFWDQWYELCHTSCLERKVVDEIYGRLLRYTKYNAPHRYFVHGDCHRWNIITNGSAITGIIDGNFMYGDFLIDIATVEDTVTGQDGAEAFRIHYENLGKPIPNFQERLLGARYFKGLDGLRFFAKMGWDHAYIEARDYLLSLPE